MSRQWIGVSVKRLALAGGLVLVFVAGGRLAQAGPMGPFQPQHHAEKGAERGEVTSAPKIESFLASSTTSALRGVALDRAALDRFYRGRAYVPAWDLGFNWKTGLLDDPARLRSFGEALVVYAAEQGVLDRKPTLADIFAGLASESDDAERAVRTEILATQLLIDFARALRGDSTDPSRLYQGWSFERSDVAEIDIPAALAQAAASNAAPAFLASLAPQHEAYRALVRHLKHYRDIERQGGWGYVPAGPTLRPGERSPRVDAVRRRLAVEGYKIDAPSQDVQLFDDGLRAAVVEYQTRNGLDPDGALGAKTVAAMNLSVTHRIGQIVANMERWRHMPSAFPARRAVVNIPAFSFSVFDNDLESYRDLVIIGRTSRKTPFIQSEIRSVIFNPSWHVPSKIARQDILPKLRKDPHYLEKMGMVIGDNADDPHGVMVDWSKVRERDFNYRLRQSPGDGNSLGRLKFDFDNDFAVYMHGTPHAELFEKTERAFSSGCIRVQDPEALAEIVLQGNAEEWSRDKITEAIDAEKTRWLRVRDPLPLYVVYWTVLDGGDGGPARFLPDLYDYDASILAARRGERRSARAAAEE